MKGVKERKECDEKENKCIVAMKDGVCLCAEKWSVRGREKGLKQEGN